MKKFRILGIAPYEGFRGFFLHAVKQYSEVEADVYSASLNQAVELIGSLDVQKYDVIVCRGRTGKMVAECTDLPVVNVEFSGYDILRSLKLAQYSERDKIAFISFFDTQKNVEFLCELLGYKKKIYNPPPSHTAKEMEQLIDNLYREGFRLFIGDGACTDYAKAIGAETILVTSGPESMAKAVDEAIKICMLKSRMEEKNTFYQCAFEQAGLPVAVFSEQGNLIYSTLFSAGNLSDVPKRLKRFVPKVIEEGPCKTICNNGKQMWRVRGSRFIFDSQPYALFYIIDSFPCLPGEEPFLTIDPKTARESAVLISNSSALASLWEKLTAQSDSKLPILIYGSAGAGKTTLANAIYAAGKYRDNPMITIDCCNLDEKKLIKLFEDERSPLFENDFTVYFNKLNTLSVQLQNKLSYYLRNMAMTSRNRVISSFTGDPVLAMSVGTFSKDLYFILGGYPIHLPTLNERAEDIPSIARIYLNQINQELPVQIVGFEPDALSLLQQFHWEYGIAQFKSAMEQLVLAVQGQIITAEKVRFVLSHMQINKEKHIPPNDGLVLDPHKTLDEMIGEIIDTVLREENYNQSQTAKRLGISRGTIWKRINK